MVCLVVVRKRLLVSLTLHYGGFSFLVNLVLKQGRVCQTRHSLMVARILVSVVFFQVVRKDNQGFVSEQQGVCRESVLSVWWFGV